MKYIVEVDREEPGQIAYGASMPAIPGCFTTGETLDELKANLVEAIELMREDARENGQPVPEAPTGFILHIEIPA